jgi:hypothetical protein
VRESLTDLAGLKVSAEDFLAADELFGCHSHETSHGAHRGRQTAPRLGRAQARSEHGRGDPGMLESAWLSNNATVPALQSTAR